MAPQPTVQIEVHAMIRADEEAVAAVLGDFLHYESFLTEDFQNIQSKTEATRGEGAALHAEMGWRGKTLPLRVGMSALLRDAEGLSLKLDGGDSSPPWEAEIRIDALDKSVRLSLICRSRPPGGLAGALAHRLFFRKKLYKLIRANLLQMKQYIEKGKTFR